MSQRRFFLVALLLASLFAAPARAEELSPNGARVRIALKEQDEPLDDGRIRMYNSVAGELFADTMAGSISAQRQFRDALPSIYTYSQTAHHQFRETSICQPGSKWVMWDVPFLTFESKKRDDGYLGYKQSVSGFATGFSRLIGERSALGFAIGYDARKMRGQDDYKMENRADTLHLALFGGTNFGCFFLDGYAGYSRSWNRTVRHVYDEENAGDYEVNKANFNHTVLSAGLKLSYAWIVGDDVRITPSVGADFSRVSANGITERGDMPNQESLLRVGKSHYANVQVPIMMSVNRTFASSAFGFGRPGNSYWTPEARVGYVPQFGDKHAKTDMAFVNQAGGTRPAFTAESAKLAGSYGTAGAGVKIKIRDRFIFAVDYDFTFGKRFTNHAVTAMYGASF